MSTKNSCFMNGSDILNFASNYIKGEYDSSKTAELKNPNYKGPWDCAEFVTYIVYWTTKSIYGHKNGEAYTGYWADEIKNKQVDTISVSDAVEIKGSILLRVPKIGIGGHIAFSDGQGGTIEAMDTKHGVCRGSSSPTRRKWDYGILIPGVSYDY